MKKHNRQPYIAMAGIICAAVGALAASAAFTHSRNRKSTDVPCANDHFSGSELDLFYRDEVPPNPLDCPLEAMPQSEPFVPEDPPPPECT